MWRRWLTVLSLSDSIRDFDFKLEWPHVWKMNVPDKFKTNLLKFATKLTSTYNFTNFNQRSTSCCSPMMSHICGSLSATRSKGLIIIKRGPDEHVIKHSTKKTPEQIYQKTRFARLGWPHDERVERKIAKLHVIQSLSLYNCRDSSCLPMMLNRE